MTADIMSEIVAGRVDGTKAPENPQNPQIKDTPEQERLYWWMQEESGNAILSSVAGSGKTSSIIEGLNYLLDTDRILIVSFTKVIAQEVHLRIGKNGHTNATSATLNAVGNGLVKERYPNATLDAFKTENILIHDIFGGRRDEAAKKLITFMKHPLKKIIGLLKAYVVRPEDVLRRAPELFEHHGIEFPETRDSAMRETAIAEFWEVTSKVYQRSIDLLDSFYDFDDQKFAPVFWANSGNLTLQSRYDGQFKYDWIIVDEAQDLNMCDLELIKLLRGDGPTRLLFVGDPKQAIYGFRGAMNNSMEIIKNAFQCKTLTLSVCWRCPDDVIEEAKPYCPQITAPSPNPRGKGTVASKTTREFIREVGYGDFVICRNTAPLVKRCLQLLTLDRRAVVKGREIGATLTGLMEGIIDKTRVTELSDFVYHLQAYKQSEVAKFVKFGREEKAEEIEDRCDALAAFAESSTNLAEMRRKIDVLFADSVPEKDVILFLTGHKCKGLQAKRVWWLRRDLCPSKKAKLDHQIEQERNLMLIITTRAEEALFFVAKEADEK